MRLAEKGRDDLTATAAYGTQAVIAAADDRHREAERLAARAEHYGHQHGASEHFYAWSRHFARGWVALRQREHERAASHFTRAHELLKRGPLRVDTSEVLTALAMADQHLGNVESASEHLTEARSILERCPDPGYLLADPRTLRLSRRTSTVSDHPANLSDREVEVLGLVGEGLITDDIARRLRLSPRTVDAHLRSIYRKINVKTRTAATRYAIAHQLTSHPASPPA
jgi:DNA-binding CsgD family transcriptional regulator